MLNRKFCLFVLLIGIAFTLGGCRGSMTAMPSSESGGATGAPPPGTSSAALPATQSPIKRIIVVVMQNHSFDNLFGTYPGADGIQPGVAGYSQADASGAMQTPFLITTDATADLAHGRTFYVNAWDNGKMDKYAAVEGDLSMGHYDSTQAHMDKLWTLAGQFALADRYFASVMSNEPANMLYMVSASDNTFAFGVQPVYGPCQKPDPAAKPFTFPNLGDQLTTAQIPWNWFHENYGDCGNYVPQENPFQYFTSTQNTSVIQDGSVFYTQLAAGTLPAISFVQPAPAHDMHPGSGPVSRSVDWLDGFVQKVQNSPEWPSVALVIIWDESGGWWDHVPPPQVDSQGLGARVPMLVVSPFAKKNYISHAPMDHTSILRFIQWNWNLPALSAREGLDADVNMKDMFQF